MGKAKTTVRVRPAAAPSVGAHRRMSTPAATPGSAGQGAKTEAATAALSERLSTLQEQLYAEGSAGGHRRLLLVLQGMDTSGKGGTVRHVVGTVDPAGVQITSLQEADPAELRARLPVAHQPRAADARDASGSSTARHYEDVLIVRVHELVPKTEWSTPLRAHQRL